MMWFLFHAMDELQCINIHLLNSDVSRERFHNNSELGWEVCKV